MNPKLLLFDIDGTLISTHGIPKKVIANVLNKRYSEFKYDRSYDFSGRTDPEIIEYLLKFDNKPVSNNIISDILCDFAIELQIEMQDGKKPEIHPGIMNLIHKLHQNEHAYLGLVTGNITEGARIKLQAANLHQYFPVGGFGDDSKNRNDLPPIAQQRAETHYRQEFAIEDIWIIGDSIHDINCAHSNNLRCLAVSTGWTSRDKLQSAGPEFLENDFSDYERIYNLLINNE